MIDDVPPLSETIDEDFEAWNLFPELRWVFNKLEVALRLGHNAGPSGVPVLEAGYYIIRPAYNLYGMGLGAKKKWIDPDRDWNDLLEAQIVPPGYFWCEYFEGEQLSIDFERVRDDWVPICAMRGVLRDSTNDLRQFDFWERVSMPENFRLPRFLKREIFRSAFLNIEMKGGKIFEVHLRSGNDVLREEPVGTRVYPIWSTDSEDRKAHLPFVENLDSPPVLYSLDRSEPEPSRLGFRIERPSFH